MDKLDIIKSTSYNQDEIINNILKLYVHQGYIDIDPTYSKGNFYKNVKEPIYKLDLYPKGKCMIKATANQLPFKNNFANCIMFDPPFLATSGKSLKCNKNNSNIINKRFSVFPNEKLLHEFYYKSLKEFYRVLKNKGVLIFKCQDKVSSGKQYLSHFIIIQQAINIGYYPRDIFILLSKNRIISSKHKNQIHARKFHSYFLVFEKIKSKVNYDKLINYN